MNYVIAIDGPAGSGKTTISNLLSKKLDISYIPAGTFYRSIAFKTLNSGITPNEQEKIINVLDDLNIEIKKTPEDFKYNEPFLVYLDNNDVTLKLKSDEISKFTNAISGIPELRTKLNYKFREIAENSSLIMEGRDVTTKVFPDAKFKFFLDADVEQRAKRRYNELMSKDFKVDFEEIKENIVMRDTQESKREYGKMKIADDAIYIDTTNLNINEVVDLMLSHIQKGNDADFGNISNLNI